MKDASTTCKYRLLVDPVIMVDNNLKVETREFLCTLLNTFYKTYANNQKHNEVIGSLNGNLGYMIRSIGLSEEQIFNLQKTQIIEQMQVEGELLSEKNKLKEEANKKKGIQEIYDVNRQAYLEAKAKYDAKKNAVAELEKKLAELNEQSDCLARTIDEQEKMRDGCQSEIDKEILYQQKLANEFTIVSKEVEIESKQSKRMLKKLYDTKVSNTCQKWNQQTGKAHRTIPEIARETMKSDLVSEFKVIRG